MKDIKEGSLYKSITIEEDIFRIYYGYYSDSERELWEPTPIYPDFTKTPVYTRDGRPYTRADQDVCERYRPKSTVSGENWCNDCCYFTLCDEILGICECARRKGTPRKSEQNSSLKGGHSNDR